MAGGMGVPAPPQPGDNSSSSDFCSPGETFPAGGRARELEGRITGCSSLMKLLSQSSVSTSTVLLTLQTGCEHAGISVTSVIALLSWCCSYLKP